MAKRLETLTHWRLPTRSQFVLGCLVCGLILGGFESALQAALLVLDVPVRCEMARDCFIQNFPDRDTDHGYRDYACGKLTYDGHTGTDFRVRDIPAMQHGVEVIAAADGTVMGMRDGEPDVPVHVRSRAALKGKDAGNGVIIDHGDGWVTQYSHLRNGSVRVKTGQRVESGAVLGLIGESGNADFPHVDFTVRHNGRALDPFAPNPAATCGAAANSLWSPAARRVLSYQPTGLLIAGFAGQPPERDRAEAGEYAPVNFAADAPFLIFWVELFGVRPQDRWQIEIFDPKGQRFASSEGVVDRYRAIIFTAAGKRRNASLWFPGGYRARFKLLRDGKIIIDESRGARVG